MLAEATAAVPVVVAPYLATDTLVAIGCAAFVSSLGLPDFSVSEAPTIHMSDTPLPIVGGLVQPPPLTAIAAPTTSAWLAASIGLRTMVDID